MQNFSELLRQKNLKKTPLRVAILEVFAEQTEPITIPQLEKLLGEKKFSQNQTSLYRQMEVLVEANIIQSIILKNSTAHFELQDHHHHHFVCEKCQKIVCTDDADLEQKIHEMEKSLKQKGLFVSGHQLSFYGTCQKCV